MLGNIYRIISALVFCISFYIGRRGSLVLVHIVSLPSIRGLGVCLYTKVLARIFCRLKDPSEDSFGFYVFGSRFNFFFYAGFYVGDSESVV